MRSMRLRRRRYKCSCSWASNDRAEALEHALGRNHWVWDRHKRTEAGNRVYLTHGTIG